MLGPPLARSTIGFWHCAGITERNMPRVQNRASQDGNSGTIERVDAFETDDRALEIIVVDGKRHDESGSGIEHPRQPILHSPIELMRTFQIKPGVAWGWSGAYVGLLDPLRAWHRLLAG